MRDFFDRGKHAEGKSIIFHTGHGDRFGRWVPWRVGPADVKAMAGSNLPVIITGCCYGGHWLSHFDGLSGCRPEHKNAGSRDGEYGPLWRWLFDGAYFPPQRE